MRDNKGCWPQLNIHAKVGTGIILLLIGIAFIIWLPAFRLWGIAISLLGIASIVSEWDKNIAIGFLIASIVFFILGFACERGESTKGTELLKLSQFL